MLQRTVFAAVLFLISAASVFAGPPFQTDDPIPVDYRHSEFYVFSSGTHDAQGTSGSGPAVEFNYGILPDTMFHVIIPMGYDAPRDGVFEFGYGDTEIGLKYRFVRESGSRPAIGIFPLVEIPTGDEDKGLGDGKAQYFFPVWLQKDFGKWTTYGGGGYWVHPGPGNKNYWFSGALLQYSMSDTFFLGGEVFYQTADSVDGRDSSGFDLGGSVPLTDGFQLLFSAGRGLKETSTNEFSYYVALYRLF